MLTALMIVYFIIYTEMIIEGPGIISDVNVCVNERLFYCSKMKGYILGYDHWNKEGFTYIGQRNKKLLIQLKIVGIVICIYSIDLTITSFIEISHIYYLGFHFVINCVYSLILFIMFIIDVCQFITLILSISLNIRSDDIVKFAIYMKSEGFLDCREDELNIICNLKNVMGSRLWEWILPIGAFHGLSDEELYDWMFPERAGDSILKA